MAIEWWRSWHGAPMDHKWPVIAARSGVCTGIVSAVAWALMDYASQNEPRGSIEGFDTEAYAVYSGFAETDIKKVIQAMTDKGIITDGRLTAWTKRQPQREDNSTDRVREWREMKRSETQCNAKKSSDKDTDKELNTGADAPSEEPVDPKTIAAAYGFRPENADPTPDFIPEDVRPLCRAFIEATNIRPVSRERAGWIKELRNQRAMGIQPADITRAVSKMHNDNLMIADIFSVTGVARGLKAHPAGTGPAASVEM